MDKLPNDYQPVNGRKCYLLGNSWSRTGVTQSTRLMKATWSFCESTDQPEQPIYMIGDIFRYRLYLLNIFQQSLDCWCICLPASNHLVQAHGCEDKLCTQEIHEEQQWIQGMSNCVHHLQQRVPDSPEGLRQRNTFSARAWKICRPTLEYKITVNQDTTDYMKPALICLIGLN